MPAIQLARLKIQITDLLTCFDQPNDFVRELHVLLEFYADRTRRSGQSGTPKPLVQAYNVPRQVMRRIEGDLVESIVNEPESAIMLSDQLWADKWFECRLIAISILGKLPLEHANQVIERLQKWGKECRDDALLSALLDFGAAQIRKETPKEYQLLVEGWLSNEELTSRKIGLRALPALVSNPGFVNLPVFYRLLAPMLREATSVLEPDLLSAVRSLGLRSPQETAYFLKQNLIAPHESGLSVIIRRSLEVFPPDLQDILREMLREEIRTQSNGMTKR